MSNYKRTLVVPSFSGPRSDFQFQSFQLFPNPQVTGFVHPGGTKHLGEQICLYYIPGDWVRAPGHLHL